MGLISAPPVREEHVESLKEESGGVERLPDSARVDSRLSFTITLADGVSVPWECRLRENKLWVDVPTNLPVYGSKDR